MARNFDSTNDVIECAIGACGVAAGPVTFAFIFDFLTGGTRVIFYVGTATSGQARMQVAIVAGNIELRLGNGTATAPTDLTGFEWQFVAVSKASGTVAPRFHKYLQETNAWVHEDAGTTLADCNAPANNVYLGNTPTQLFGLGADLAVMGMWDVVLTDAQVESLPFNLAAWYAPKNPLGLWVLDQDAVTQNVIDLTGNGANQTALTGTTVATSSVPLWTPGAPIGMPV